MPDTNSYLVLGFIVVFGVLSLYISSLIVRLRNAHKDAVLIQEMINE